MTSRTEAEKRLHPTRPGRIRLFIDDIRDPPDQSWTVARTYDDAVNVIKTRFEQIEVISFDHDLGECDGKEGYDVAGVIEHMVNDLGISEVPEMKIHSGNPPGRARLTPVIDSINRMASGFRR